MKLMTKEIERRIPALYEQDGRGDDAIVHAKFFTPTSSFTWYALEFDGDDTFFGLVVSHMCPQGELGYFSLSELQGLRGPLGVGVERDRHFGTPRLGDVPERKAIAS